MPDCDDDEITVMEGPKTVKAEQVLGYSMAPDTGAVDRYTATRWQQDGMVYYCPTSSGQPVVEHTQQSLMEASLHDKRRARRIERDAIVSWLRKLGKISEPAKHIADMIERGEHTLPGEPK